MREVGGVGGGVSGEGVGWCWTFGIEGEDFERLVLRDGGKRNEEEDQFSDFTLGRWVALGSLPSTAGFALARTSNWRAT